MCSAVWYSASMRMSSSGSALRPWLPRPAAGARSPGSWIRSRTTRMAAAAGGSSVLGSAGVASASDAGGISPERAAARQKRRTSSTCCPPPKCSTASRRQGFARTPPWLPDLDRAQLDGRGPQRRRLGQLLRQLADRGALFRVSTADGSCLGLAASLAGDWAQVGMGTRSPGRVSTAETLYVASTNGGCWDTSTGAGKFSRSGVHGEPRGQERGAHGNGRRGLFGFFRTTPVESRSSTRAPPA